ncbi:AAA family ATPase [Leptolyngbya sp. FACHB-711]|uniref:AAA family ATPase n=1 Tax=Leptolyngbya sp. FACHB-711 TaxID=2692813 RepID=UPI00168309E0|nr:AAA family ATPase [Leptolyngbya sp. FACHB-711]MBD2027816.1 AAA family ATPase [Leptolyngbya sp. FACHB-711]
MAIPGEQADGFANNWAYLKTELQWLERVLLLAVARQRKDTKEIDRFSQTAADRATSHWWKGIISLDTNVAYDEHRQPQSSAKSTYPQQLEAQIQASQRQGNVLALPALRDRLRLSEFEKNLVLMALAPEVNRRFAQLYRFLQGNEGGLKPDLPMLDLVLRLLCRTDADWYTARYHLLNSSPLLKTELVNLLPCTEQTRLSSPVKLSDRLVNYLLATHPTQADLDTLLHPPAPKAAAPVAVISRCVYLQRQTATVAWSDVVLPPECLSSLQYLTQQVAGQRQAEEVWNLGAADLGRIGRFALVTGKPGTGKTTVAAAAASALDVPLFTVDLAQIDPANYSAVLKEISLYAPTVVLIKSAQKWLSRSSTLSIATLHRFLEERSKLATLTCFNVTHLASVQLQWQRQMDGLLRLPLPAAMDRLKLWQRAFPSSVAVSERMPWQLLADHLLISGGTIQELAQDMIRDAAAMGATTIEITHLQTVCQQHGYDLKLPAALLKPKSSRNSSRKSSRKSSAAESTPSVALSILPETLSEALPETLPDLLSEVPPETLPDKAAKPSAATRRKRTGES